MSRSIVTEGLDFCSLGIGAWTGKGSDIGGVEVRPEAMRRNTDAFPHGWNLKITEKAKRSHSHPRLVPNVHGGVRLGVDGDRAAARRARAQAPLGRELLD